MNNINKEAKWIATKLNIDHKINSIAEQPAFITIKDHKPNFKINPSYRLINPTKSEIGRISKHIQDNINTQLKDKLPLNQWKNTKAVTNWFTAITKKKQYSLHPIRHHRLLPFPHRMHIWQSSRISSPARTRLTKWYQDHQPQSQITPLPWQQTMIKIT